MAKYITKIGIPEPYFGARVAFARHPKDKRISVTELLQPPRAIALKRRHWNDTDPETGLETFIVNVDDMTAAFYGGAAHAFIQTVHDRKEKRQSHISQYLMEETLSMPHHGWAMSGRPDLYQETKFDDLPEAAQALIPERKGKGSVGLITDWKTMKAYSWKRQSKNGYKPVKQQMDLYAFLLRWSGFNPVLGYAGITITDWSVWGGRRYEPGDYPPQDYIHLWYKLCPADDAAELFADRFEAHQEAAGKGDDDLPVCSREERWQTDEKWSVMRAGNKNATKVCWQKNDDEPGTGKKAAEAFIAERDNPAEYSLRHRPGESVRCQRKWCLAWQVCKVGQAFRPAGEED